MSKAEGVPVRVMCPSRAGRSKLRDVAHRHERPFRVVDERNALCLEVADHGLEIGHLEVGKRVISDRGGRLKIKISLLSPQRNQTEMGPSQRNSNPSVSP